MKLLVEVHNPRRPVSYVSKTGFASNPSEAHHFESVSDSIEHSTGLQPFLHQEDQFVPRFVDVSLKSPTPVVSPLIEVAPEITPPVRKPQVTIVNTYDYQGLFVDGRLVWQDHRIDTYDLVDHLPDLSVVEAADDFDVQEGFPPSLADVVLKPSA